MRFLIVLSLSLIGITSAYAQDGRFHCDGYEECEDLPIKKAVLPRVGERAISKTAESTKCEQFHGDLTICEDGTISDLDADRRNDKRALPTNVQKKKIKAVSGI